MKTKPNTGLFSSSSGSEIWPMLLPPMPKLQMSTNPSALLNMSWGTPTSYRAPRGRFSLAWHGVLQCSWYSWPTGSLGSIRWAPTPSESPGIQAWNRADCCGHHHPIPALVSQKNIIFRETVYAYYAYMIIYIYIRYITIDTSII